MVKNEADFIKNPFVFAALILAFLIYTGLLSPFQRHPYSSLISLEDISLVTGKVSSNPSKTSSGNYSFYFEMEKGSSKNKISSSASGLIQIEMKASDLEANYPGKLYSISKGTVLVEKGCILELKGNWNKKSGVFFAEDFKYKGFGSGFLSFLAYIRAMSRLVFKRLMFSWGDAGALVLSLLSGSREFLNRDVCLAFRDSGLSHVLALSGMHLSFFSGLSRKMGSFAGKSKSDFFVFFAILIFTWFAGLSPSLFRAFLFSLLLIISRYLFCRSLDSVSLLSACFLFHVLIFPLDFKEISFILSYSSLFGIMIAGKFFKFILTPFFPENLSSSLSASLGAQSATFPVSAFYFGTVSPVGIISTLFVSPLISIFMGFSVLALILCLLMPFLSGPFGAIINLIYKIIKLFVCFFAKASTLSF